MGVGKFVSMHCGRSKNRDYSCKLRWTLSDAERVDGDYHTRGCSRILCPVYCDSATVTVKRTDREINRINKRQIFQTFEHTNCVYYQLTVTRFIVHYVLHICRTASSTIQSFW